MRPSSRRAQRGPLELMWPPKALSQRQQAKELMGLSGRKQHSPGAGRAISAPAHLVPRSALAHPGTSALTRNRPLGSQQLPAFPQPPFPSVEYTMSSKCFLGAGKEWVLVPLPIPGRLRTKDPRPHRAQNMGALWSVPASEALPTGERSCRSPG